MGSKSRNLRILETAGFRVPVFIDVVPSILTKNELESAVIEYFGTNSLFAVRSSAMIEDGAEKSYAGYFCSEIAVSLDKLYDAYKRVSDSLQGFDAKVIVQQFILSDKSGVVFTDNGQGLIIVNSNFGLCKTVVEGFSCDEWYLTSNNKLIRKYIASDKGHLYLLITKSETMKLIQEHHLP